MQNEHKALASRWLERIDERMKTRDRRWGEDAERAEKAYSADESMDHGDVMRFNIVFSNTETIVPAIFNSAPLPDIRERFKQGDTIARQAADGLERIVSTMTDDGAMSSEIESVARDAALAGRGILRVRLERGPWRVAYEAVSWRDYVEGEAARWDQVPWVAFKHKVSKDEVARLSDEAVVASQSTGNGKDDEKRNSHILWEVWDKQNRMVHFIRYDGAVLLSSQPDPLGLPGFFPVCQPIQPLTLTGKRDPVCPVKLYMGLAKEVDRLTQRIDAIVSGLKVKGAIGTGGGDIERLSEADDNEIITLANAEALMGLGNLDNAVMWWPVDKAITVLRELYVAREAAKQTVYEVTGISDIVRGASKTAETATAQQIKTQWGSLRIKRLQQMLERLIREAFIMTVDLASRHFDEQALSMSAGMRFEPQHMELIRSAEMHYRIDVESDSTVRGDLARAKGEMSEFLNGTANYFSVMQPLVAQEPALAGGVVSLYASFARQFNLGRQAEDSLDEIIELAMQAGQQPQSNPEAEAAQAEMQMKVQEAQMKAQQWAEEFAHKRETTAAELHFKRETTAADLQLKAAELKLKEAELEFQAAKGAAEIEIERDQERPAAIG